MNPAERQTVGPNRGPMQHFSEQLNKADGIMGRRPRLTFTVMP